MKLLLSAFACDPTMGSEPYVGWNWSIVASKVTETTVITRKHHKVNLRNRTHCKFIFFDLPFCANIDHRARYIKIYYVFWQLLLPLYLLIFARTKYDAIHHITYNNIDVPGFLWLIPRSKFYWGPVGGGQTPPEVLKEYFYKSWNKQIIRSKLKSFAKFNPVVFLACWRASTVLVANQDTLMKLPKTFNSKYILELETAVFSKPLQIKTSHNRNLLWVGQIEERKALRIALHVLESILSKEVHQNYKLTVVGEGPLFDIERDYALNNKLPVEFTGKLALQDVQNHYTSADAMLFTSLQDTSGNVILEAISSGIPCFAPKHHGAALILKDFDFFLVDIASKDKFIREYADKVRTYMNSSSRYKNELRESLHDHCIKNFSWESKTDVAKAIYWN